MPVSATPLDLQNLCSHVLDEFRAAHPHRTLQFESSGDTSGEWDEARLRQVISNLIANAIQHGSDAAPIDISARGEGSEVVIAVTNQGPPISPSALPTIFDPFVRASEESTTHRPRGGIGLGLYIARQIVLAHSGTIAVDSSETTGTAFKVRLPRQRHEA